MKKLALSILLLPSLVFGQTISVNEEMAAIDGKSRNSLTVIIKEAPVNEVKKAWKKQLKDFKGKVSDKSVIFADNCKVKSMGDNTFDVYSTLEEVSDKDVKLIAAFDLGGAYLSTAKHPEKYPAAEKLIKSFAVEQAKQAVKAEIDVVEKVVKGFEKDLNGLVKDKEKLENDIKDYEKKIEEAKAAIEQNIVDQANKKSEIEGMKASIIDLEKKRKAIK